MTASTPALTGTYGFNPNLGSLTIQAFQMCSVRPTALTAEHMESARMAANLLLSRWAGQGVSLWQIAATTVPLVQGMASYAVPSNVVAILDAYITVASGGANTDRIIMPVSRSEYASYPNKAQQGFPTVFWFDKLLTSPVVNLWPVPDGNEASLTYYALLQMQDASIGGGTLLDIPYYFLEPFVYGLAQRLALIWKPELAVGYKALADEAYEIASTRNTEPSSLYISPMVGSYWRT
jgi:hypothetical protein